MRLALGLLTAILACGSAMAAEAPPSKPLAPMTMAEAGKLSDDALTRRVLDMFDQTPELAARRPSGFAALAADTVQIERPVGYIMPTMFPIGFDALTLVLRARPTAVSATLCEQPRLTLGMTPVAPIDIAGPPPATRPTRVEEGRRFVSLAPPDTVRPITQADITAKPVTRCADLRSNTGAIDAVDADTAWTGLQLFAQAKQRIKAGAPPRLSCAADWRSPPELTHLATCANILLDAPSDQIFDVHACRGGDAGEDEIKDEDTPSIPPGERCMVVSGARHRTMTAGDGWRAYIVYRPGARPVISAVRLASWAYIV